MTSLFSTIIYSYRKSRVGAYYFNKRSNYAHALNGCIQGGTNICRAFTTIGLYYCSLEERAQTFDPKISICSVQCVMHAEGHLRLPRDCLTLFCMKCHWQTFLQADIYRGMYHRSADTRVPAAKAPTPPHTDTHHETFQPPPPHDDLQRVPAPRGARWRHVTNGHGIGLLVRDKGCVPQTTHFIYSWKQVSSFLYISAQD